MPACSGRAADILEHMEPNRGYEASELRQFDPELSAEALCEVMRELWIDRQVERFGYSGWRKVRSTSGLPQAPDVAGTRQADPVKPEDLFDHDSFTGVFK
jgi:hypothetical protein